MTKRTRVFIRYTVWLWVLLLAACSRTKEWVVLLPEDDGRVGRVVIEDRDRTVVLDKPFATAEINARGRVKTRVTTQEAINQTFRQVLSAEPREAMHFILYFQTGTTIVVPDSQATLDDLFEEVEHRQAVEVQITGHTDTVGTGADNDRLALDRAQMVRDMLTRRGLKSNFMRAVGRGERALLIATPDEQEESRNRRVEIIVR